MRYLLAFVVLSAAMSAAMSQQRSPGSSHSAAMPTAVTVAPALPTAPVVDPWLELPMTVPAQPPADIWLDSATAALAFVRELADCRRELQFAGSALGFLSNCSVAALEDGSLVFRDESDLWVRRADGDWSSLPADNLPSPLRPVTNKEIRHAEMLHMASNSYGLDAGIPPNATVTGSATSGWELRTVTSRSENGSRGQSMSFTATGAGADHVCTWFGCGRAAPARPTSIPRMPTDPG